MSTAPRVEAVTFGCRLNIVESEAMTARARAAGHTDLTIVNTCAVTAEAVRQSRQAIRRIRRERPASRIVVTGCAVEVDAHLRAMPEIDAFLPNAAKSADASWPALKPAAPTPHASMHTRGFVEVQNGCDHRCTFCIIPFGRGASRSRPIDEVLTKIHDLVERGTREVVLTGVDLTSYGFDHDGQPGLGRLVRRILADVPALPRLRLSSLDCIEADPALFDALAEEPRLMPHLHLSIQAGSDLILKRMKRRHGRAGVIAFCEKVRALRPGLTLGADFIAGFPTETEAMFAETLDLIEACGLDFIHAFPFSPRPGTPAARMPAVPPETVRERAARLRAAGDRRLRQHLEARVGRRVSVLSERGGKGHAEDFSAVRLPPATPPGVLLDMSITSVEGRLLVGEVVEA